MSNISTLIKICKIKKLPQEVEDLIFEYLGSSVGFVNWYKNLSWKISHISYSAGELRNYNRPALALNLLEFIPLKLPLKIYLLNCLIYEQTKALANNDICFCSNEVQRVIVKTARDGSLQMVKTGETEQIYIYDNFYIKFSLKESALSNTDYFLHLSRFKDLPTFIMNPHYINTQFKIGKYKM